MKKNFGIYRNTHKFGHSMVRSLLTLATGLVTLLSFGRYAANWDIDYTLKGLRAEAAERKKAREARGW